MNIQQILQLNDGDKIDFTGSIKGAYPAKKVGRFMRQNFIVEDPTGSLYLTFSGKSNTNQPVDNMVGRTITVKDAKFEKDDKNNGKYDKIIALDSTTVAYGNNGGPQQTAAPQSKPQVQSTESVKDIVQRIAKMWIQVRKWAEPVFAEADVPLDRELVTSMMMGLKNRGILDFPIEGEKIEWKSVIVNKIPLEKWEPGKMINLIIAVMRSPDKLPAEKVSAIMAAKEELNITNVDLLDHIVSEAGVSVEAYHNVLLGRMVAHDSISEEQAKELISDPKFPDELKAKYEQLSSNVEEEIEIE